ncbi:MAG: carboxypeptidase-like regulatory domain-containing protein [Ferruginibacter sp.]
MKFFFSLIALLCINIAVAQTNAIIGVVIDAEKSLPLPNSNVFISNTNKGIITDNAGKFALYNVPEGKSLELVVSCIGYETFTYTFSSTQLPLNLKISLNNKIVEMNNLVIIPVDTRGWEKWGRTFMNNFLGESENGYGCEIENSRNIKFRYNKKEGVLEASSDEMLIIRNYKLGYFIKYQLENFVLDFKKNRVSYSGYPLFQEMEPNQPLDADYRRRRLKAYNGSIMHFIRSLYADKLKEEGFKVMRMVRTLVDDTIINDRRSAHKLYVVDSAGNKQATRNIIRKTYRDKIDTILLSRDSIVFSGADNIKDILSFNNFLYVQYMLEKEPAEYRSTYRLEPKRDFQLSKFTILNDDKIILIAPGGYYYPGLELFVEGYLAWEKIGDLLPMDYMPAKD